MSEVNSTNGEVKKLKRKSVSFKIDLEIRRMQTSGYQNSILDSKPSRVLSFPLTLNQQIWMNFLLPTILTATIYIVDLSTDLSIGIELINENHIWAGITTLLITYSPAIICYAIHLMNPPPENKFKKLFHWFLIETTNLFLYFLRPIYCFGERMFWAIEALRQNDPHREQALIAFEESKRFAVENYLFLQALLHAAPQALFQLTLLIIGTSRDEHTELMQALGVGTSLMSLSVIATSYQRYETQAKGGRKRIWLKTEDAVDGDEPRVLLSTTGEENYPRRRSWTKIMDEDNPVGKLMSFTFWFLFLLGRCVCLVMAATFFPWAVLGVCCAHYIFTLLYILPTPNCKTNILTKILLSFVYIFCLIEVGIHFRKSFLFHALFIIFSIVENFSLTLLWVLWAKWNGWWYYYSLYFMGITHTMAIFFLLIYIKFFKPPIRRVQPSLN